MKIVQLYIILILWFQIPTATQNPYKKHWDTTAFAIFLFDLDLFTYPLINC